MKKQEPTVPESNPEIKPNLDPNALKVKPEGWSAEDRARNLLDIWNSESNEKKQWEYSEFVKEIYPPMGTHDFVEGFLLATIWMGGAISGGYVRDHLRKKDSKQGVLDGLKLQRFLDWVESHKEVN